MSEDESSTADATSGEETDSEANQEADETPDWARLDRERGILTTEDRKFITGQKELSDSAERNARFRVRKRVQNAFHDFHLLTEFLDPDDREQVFQKIHGNPIDSGFAIYDTITFLYQGLSDVSEDNEELDQTLRDSIESSIKHVERHRGIQAMVTFNIDRREPDIDNLRNKIEGGHASLHELSLYLEETKDSEIVEEVIERDGELELRIGDETISLGPESIENDSDE